jgi:zinc ribbon protein
MNCHACGTQLASTARFCHKCGAHLRGAQATGWRAGLPWALAGVAVGALITVVGLRLTGGTSAGASPQDASPPQDAIPLPQAGVGPGRPPDISQMSPEERATRLYNRIMTLHAAGKADSAEFFLPMALQAYAMLPALDIDAHYHMGVLRLTGGDAAGALAEADSIRRRAATHLFGFVLRAQALELQHDSRRAQQAYRAFLQNEAAERARRLPEYTDHAQNLDFFHQRAVEATGGKAKPAT